MEEQVGAMCGMGGRSGWSPVIVTTTMKVLSVRDEACKVSVL